jgi:hypothetical protein
MNTAELKFKIYQIVNRFLVYKVTCNLKRIYLDVDIESARSTLTAYYEKQPSELEIELLDDIVTDSNAHLPDHFIDYNYKLLASLTDNEKHDFTVFAFYFEVDD